MVLILAATLMSATPVIVVTPFEVNSPDSADDDLGLVMQSLVVHELAAVGLESSTAEVKGTTHVATGTVIRTGPELAVIARLIDPRDNKILRSIKLSGATVWNDRRQFTSAVMEELKLPMPARRDGYDVNEELARAWGGALRALKTGNPKLAKEKLSAIVAKWPKFMPAKAQLAKL